MTAAKLDILHCFDKRLRTWSPGDRRKMSVAIAFLGNPKLVLLDEPTTGLDPYARRKLVDFILNYQQLHCNPYQRQLHAEHRQPCIIFSTMSVRNAELLSSRMGIMQGGFFSCIGEPEVCSCVFPALFWSQSSDTSHCEPDLWFIILRLTNGITP